MIHDFLVAHVVIRKYIANKLIDQKQVTNALIMSKISNITSLFNTKAA